MNLPPRVSVVGAEISICNAADALQLLQQRLDEGGGGYVCFSNAHAAVMCRQNERFREVTARSFLSVADGKPVWWAGQLKGASGLGHVPGPDFILQVLQRFPLRRHYFYGSTPETLTALLERLRRKIPGVQVCGQFSPPFGPRSAEQLASDVQRINESRPEFIWIGLGAPKQELWMADAWHSLRPAILFGVGAAFDFHADTVRRAPGLLRDLGLEWLFRLLQEPRRLWRRYLVTNSLFLFYSARDAVRRPASDRTGS